MRHAVILIIYSKISNFRMDFNPYELYTQAYPQKYSHLNTKNSKKY